MKPVQDIMERFGLNKSEARVYLSLLTINEGKASDILKNCTVPRTKIYEITKSLHKKGFIEIIPDRVIKFKAVPFEKAFSSLLEEKEKEIKRMHETKEKISKILEKNFNADPKAEEKGIGEFSLIKSKKIIYRKIEDILEKTGKIKMIIESEDLRQIHYLKTKISRNPDVKILTRIEKNNIDIINKWLNFKIKAYTNRLPLKIFMNENEVLIFKTDTPLGLYTKDPNFHELIESFFYQKWDISPNASEKIMEIKTGRPVEDIKYISNIKQLYSFLPEIVKNAKKDVTILTTENGIIRSYKYLLDPMTEAIRRGIKFRYIVPFTSNNIEIIKKMSKYAEIRHIDKTEMIIGCHGDSYVVLMPLKKDSPQISFSEEIGIISSQKKMIMMMNHMLENIWETAKDMDSKIIEMETGKTSGEIRYIRGREKFYAMLPGLLQKTKKELLCSTTPFGIVRAYNYGLNDLLAGKKAGIQYRFMCPINKDNLEAAKKFSKYFELRHIDKTHISIICFDDSHAMLINVKNDEKGLESADDIIFTNQKETATMMKLVLENLWSKNSVSLEDRIRELEGDTIATETKEITPEEGFQRSLKLIGNAKKNVMISISPNTFERLAAYNFEKLIQNNIKINIATPISKENIDKVKKLMEFAEIKHIPKPSLRATIVDDQNAVMVIVESGKYRNSIYSNDKKFVESAKSFFDDLWESGMDAKLRIQELDKGIMSSRVFVIVGTENIELKSMEMDTRVKESNDVIITGETLARYAKTWNQINKKLHVKNVKIRVITEIDKNNIAAAKKYMEYAEVRHKVIGNESRIKLIDNKEGMLIYGQYSNEGPTCIWFNDVSQANAIKNAFEKIWEDSMPAETRIKELES